MKESLKSIFFATCSLLLCVGLIVAGVFIWKSKAYVGLSGAFYFGLFSVGVLISLSIIIHNIYTIVKGIDISDDESY